MVRRRSLGGAVGAGGRRRPGDDSTSDAPLVSVLPFPSSPTPDTMEAQALPSAPLKLTFRLGGAASATSTSTSPSASLAGGNASASPPASEADYAMSEAGSIAGAAPTPVTPAVATAATTAAPVAPAGATKKRKPAAPVFGEDGIEIPKPKRKRAPRRPVGEAGPGKSWRKGMKGWVSIPLCAYCAFADGRVVYSNLAGLAGSIVGTRT